MPTFSIAGWRYPVERAIRFKLPAALKEISGLSLDQAGRLFGHDDEIAIIYEIDYREGRMLRRFALDGGVKGDFEGIAATPEHLYLITSSGTLLETKVGPDGGTVPYTRYPAKLDCEVEGLAYVAEEQALVAACKNLYKQKKRTAVRLFRWPLARRSFEKSDDITLPRTVFDDVPALNGHDRLQPTGVAVAPNGNLVIIAGKQRLLLELTTGGSLVAVAELPHASAHPQPEGIAITRDGVLLIADEGLGKGKQKSEGRLSVYQPDKP